VLGPGGSCRRRCSPGPDDVCSLRLALAAEPIFDDFILGPQRCTTVPDDIVLRRRDGLHAYALAVVVDDACQGITHVLRGRDLLTQTPAQREMFPLLGNEPPVYGHIPLIHNDRGVKLSKQSGAAAIADERPLANLRRALRFLHQDSADADVGSVEELLRIAARRWSRAPLAEAEDAPLTEERPGNG
jgi:glutamyl-Q tRNA(Asp) synthetase